jgi:hypothetical protein
MYETTMVEFAINSVLTLQGFKEMGRAAGCAGQTICDLIFVMDVSLFRKRISLSSSTQLMEAGNQLGALHSEINLSGDRLIVAGLVISLVV